MTTILQDRVPFLPWHSRGSAGLPGVQPLGALPWLSVDGAYGGQMSERRRLLTERRADVLQIEPVAHPAAEELLDLVLTELTSVPGFDATAGRVVCPDGHRVAVDRSDPLRTIGRIVQEDFCLLTPTVAGHILTGAVLCFPAGWTLAEKLGRDLGAVHRPVRAYDAGIERRVDRLFDHVRAETALWRMNALLYDDPSLFQPKPEAESGVPGGARSPYLRCEFQTIRRLPRSGAVVFGIHTYVVLVASLSAEDRSAARKRAARSDTRPGD